jgi:transcriptional regulator, tetR family
MPRPRKPLAPERRARLMRAARAYFARHGYRGASLQRILSEADFPRSSFYHFFQEKGALFDAALADGLTLLAGRIEVADPGTLTAESYWPTVLGLVEALGRACRNEDLAAVPVLFHLRDAPPSATRDRFERAAHQWCTLMVERGRALGKLERDLPADLHVELTWNMMVALDRWLATHPEHMDDSTRIACVLLTRMLKAADQ